MSWDRWPLDKSLRFVFNNRCMSAVTCSIMMIGDRLSLVTLVFLLTRVSINVTTAYKTLTGECLRFAKFFLQFLTRALHQGIAMAATFDDTWFNAAGPISDFVGCDMT